MRTFDARISDERAKPAQERVNIWNEFRDGVFAAFDKLASAVSVTAIADVRCDRGNVKKPNHTRKLVVYGASFRDVLAYAKIAPFTR